MDRPAMAAKPPAVTFLRSSDKDMRTEEEGATMKAEADPRARSDKAATFIFYSSGRGGEGRGVRGGG
jgi:hypothetical protein